MTSLEASSWIASGIPNGILLDTFQNSFFVAIRISSENYFRHFFRGFPRDSFSDFSRNLSGTPPRSLQGFRRDSFRDYFWDSFIGFSGFLQGFFPWLFYYTGIYLGILPRYFQRFLYLSGILNWLEIFLEMPWGIPPEAFSDTLPGIISRMFPGFFFFTDSFRDAFRNTSRYSSRVFFFRDSIRIFERVPLVIPSETSS